MTDLFVAASIGDAPGVDYFLRVQGLAVDASDGRGWKPIHHASLHGQAKVVELLIRRGANVNCKTISGSNSVLFRDKFYLSQINKNFFRIDPNKFGRKLFDSKI